jgi:5-methyltetrahydrofolate--homocysteine methyltransferase
VNKKSNVLFRRVGMDDFTILRDAIIEGYLDETSALTYKLIEQGKEPLDIINYGLLEGMTIVGERFKEGDMYIPEVLMSGKAVSLGMEIVRPLIAEADVPAKCTIVIATVQGDLHEIGKNLVAMILETGGFNVINLGADVSPADFLAAVKEHNPKIVCMSALLTTTMMAMKDTIDLLIKEGLRDKVKIFIGGAPISQEFAAKIGADGYSADAMSAKALCLKAV